jgi:hypothetical protein
MSRWPALGLVFALLVPAMAPAQSPAAAPDRLLDKMTGHWVLDGTIAGAKTTHDVDASWVLGRGYLQMHEVSREKDATGKTAYEAYVYLSFDPKTGQYACLWLDTTSNAGLTGGPIGRGPAVGDEIQLLFNSSDGTTFHTTFGYDRARDSWKWTMDGEDHGALTPFARVTLRRTPSR